MFMIVGGFIGLMIGPGIDGAIAGERIVGGGAGG